MRLSTRILSDYKTSVKKIDKYMSQTVLKEIPKKFDSFYKLIIKITFVTSRFTLLLCK